MDDGIGLAQESSEMVGVDEGAGSPVPEPATEVSVTTSESQPEVIPAGYEGVPRELWPGPDGKPPELTPALMKRLRGKYFTVRMPHGECGHRIDSINQPKNNCDTCWLVFFTTHPQLVEVAHQFHQTQGRGPMVGMRGEKFVRFFERYMSTLYKKLIEEKKRESKNSEPGSAGDNGTVVASEITGATEG